MDRSLINNHVWLTNRSRLKVISIVSLCFSIFVLVTDFFFSGLWPREHLHLYKILDVTFAGLSILAVFLFWYRSPKCEGWQKMAVFTFPLLILVWASVLNGFDYDQFGLSTVITVIFFATSFLILNPPTVIIYFATTAVALLLTIFIKDGINAEFFTTLFLLVPIFTIAAYLSTRIYRYYIEGLISSEELARLNSELKDSNITLEQEVEKRTIELQSALEKSEDSDRLKSAFLSNMSHEIRTPLNAIMGFSELFRYSDNTPDDISYYISQMQSGKDDLLDVIENMTFASKIETKQFHTDCNSFALNDSLDRVTDYAKELTIRYCKPQLEIHSDYIATSNLFIESDEKSIISALRQLVSNAVKFSDSGTIELTSSLKGRKKLEVYVKDEGLGMEEADTHKIFDRFHKIEAKSSTLYRGAGIGLTIVKGIADILGGEVFVESSPGAGSIFCFSIPIKITKSEPRYHLNAESGKSIPLGWGNINILIAEDADNNLIYLDKVLDCDNINRYHARNGQEAIEVFRSVEIDLVLMDILMPEVNGYEATAEIKKMSPNVPVIAQTALYCQLEGDHELAELFDDYLVKPINPKTLIETLDKFLRIKGDKDEH